jgi:hypothetical protein
MPLILRETKEAALTFTELDGNFLLLFSGSENGTYIEYNPTITSLVAGNGFGDILIATANLSITASQVVSLSNNSTDLTKLLAKPALQSESGSFIGIALQSVNSESLVKVLTQGYYAVNPSTATSIPVGFFVGPTSTTGAPIYFSGSFVTSTKPATAALTRPAGHMLTTETNNNGTKFIKFSPSVTTLG